MGADQAQWRHCGKLLSTRTAYLADTIAPNGIAVAVTGYIMRNHMAGWGKHPRHIDWSVIVRRWAGRPTIADGREQSAVGCGTTADELTRRELAHRPLSKS